MYKNLISENFLSSDYIETTRNNYINAKPFSHIVIDNFFEEDFLKKILLNFPDLKKAHSYEKKDVNEKKFGLEDISLMIFTSNFFFVSCFVELIISYICLYIG